MKLTMGEVVIKADRVEKAEEHGEFGPRGRSGETMVIVDYGYGNDLEDLKFHVGFVLGGDETRPVWAWTNTGWRETERGESLFVPPGRLASDHPYRFVILK